MLHIYQRAMRAIFNDMMHTLMDYYVYDIIVKSRTREGHIEVFEKVFLILF